MSVRGWTPEYKRLENGALLTELLDGGLELLVFFNSLGFHNLSGSTLGAYKKSQPLGGEV